MSCQAGLGLKKIFFLVTDGFCEDQASLDNSPTVVVAFCLKVILVIDPELFHTVIFKCLIEQVVTRIDTPMSDCHLHSKYMIGVL